MHMPIKRRTTIVNLLVVTIHLKPKRRASLHFHFVDNRSEAVAQRNLQDMASLSPQAKQLRAFHKMVNNTCRAEAFAQFRGVVDNHLAAGAATTFAA